MHMKYRFKILHSTKKMKQVSNFLKRLDLGMYEIGIEETMTFESSKDLDINEVKKLIKKAIEECDGELLFIEGGKIE